MLECDWVIIRNSAGARIAMPRKDFDLLGIDAPENSETLYVSWPDYWSPALRDDSNFAAPESWNRDKYKEYVHQEDLAGKIQLAVLLGVVGAVIGMTISQEVAIVLFAVGIITGSRMRPW